MVYVVSRERQGSGTNHGIDHWRPAVVQHLHWLQYRVGDELRLRSRGLRTISEAYGVPCQLHAEHRVAFDTAAAIRPPLQ
jgi:hypothetical protein